MYPNIDRVPTIYVLNENKKNITILHLKIIIFTAVKNCGILRRRGIVILKVFTVRDALKSCKTEPIFTQIIIYNVFIAGSCLVQKGLTMSPT